MGLGGVRPPNTGQSESEVKVSVTPSCPTPRHWPDSWKISSQWRLAPLGRSFLWPEGGKCILGREDPREQALPISLTAEPAQLAADAWMGLLESSQASLLKGGQYVINSPRPLSSGRSWVCMGGCVCVCADGTVYTSGMFFCPKFSSFSHRRQLPCPRLSGHLQ